MFSTLPRTPSWATLSRPFGTISEPAGKLYDLKPVAAGAYRAATLADGKTQTLFHCYRGVQLNFQLYVVPGITISVPSGSFAVPVTSVVRK